MAIQLTEQAARQIRQSIVEKRGAAALRLGVKKVGCSGLAYTFDVADAPRPDDALFEAHDAKVVVARDELPFLDGSTLDFVREGLKESFRVQNPNARSACGCGESFSI
jgi:iron-sulfur cluster assembly protein